MDDNIQQFLKMMKTRIMIMEHTRYLRCSNHTYRLNFERTDTLVEGRTSDVQPYHTYHSDMLENSKPSVLTT